MFSGQCDPKGPHIHSMVVVRVWYDYGWMYDLETPDKKHNSGNNYEYMISAQV